MLMISGYMIPPRVKQEIVGLLTQCQDGVRIGCNKTRSKSVQMEWQLLQHVCMNESQWTSLSISVTINGSAKYWKKPTSNRLCPCKKTLGTHTELPEKMNEMRKQLNLQKEA